jgi:radical SAM superfamily enzyme YgiQ (UPF0313 family)
VIIEPVIRPPAEAYSFLLQITTGCSSNNCSFCGAYLNKPFKIKDHEEIISDIEECRKAYPDVRRVFLMDGDALAVSNSRLVPVLEYLNKSFPLLTRISSYANGYNITTRSDLELKELYDKKLKLIYLGLESGSQEVLGKCKKRSSADEMVKAVRRAAEFSIKSSVIVLLGLGGKKYSELHVTETIKALNAMQPRYLSFLSVMLIPGTPLFEEAKRGEFEELDANELLAEAYGILKGLNMKKTIFRSNHASNYLALEGRLPHDKERLLKQIEHALAGKTFLRPESARGL